jgi:hypothetical protein
MPAIITTTAAPNPTSPATTTAQPTPHLYLCPDRGCYWSTQPPFRAPAPLDFIRDNGRPARCPMCGSTARCLGPA